MLINCRAYVSGVQFILTNFGESFTTYVLATLEVVGICCVYGIQFFSVLFYLMLFSLGVGSAVSRQMAVITVICDQFPSLPKFWVTAVTCAACFLIVLIYCTSVRFLDNNNMKFRLETVFIYFACVHVSGGTLYSNLLSSRPMARSNAGTCSFLQRYAQVTMIQLGDS